MLYPSFLCCLSEYLALICPYYTVYVWEADPTATVVVLTPLPAPPLASLATLKVAAYIQCVCVQLPIYSPSCEARLSVAPPPSLPRGIGINFQFEDLNGSSLCLRLRWDGGGI
jgi:hypothetical protein